MKFGEIKKILPLKISEHLASDLYNIEDSRYANDRELLSDICSIFSDQDLLREIKDKKFACFIERKAINAFMNFANEIYTNKRHEATGLIVGYYLFNEQQPDAPFIVATHFLQATGNTTSVTCEFSYTDGANHSSYCKEHKLLPLIWVHSHPGFGAFYSGTDCSTLQNYFYADHQVGVVIDNIKLEYLAYKMYSGIMKEEDIYCFDLDKSLNCKKLILERINKGAQKTLPKREPISWYTVESKKKSEKRTIEEDINAFLRKILEALEIESNKSTILHRTITSSFFAKKEPFQYKKDGFKKKQLINSRELLICIIILLITLIIINVITIFT